MKKLLMLLFSLTMVFATAAVVTACEEETTQPCTVHIDNDNNDICDVCQESLVPVVKEVNVSFTVKELDGPILAGVSVTFERVGETPITAVSGADGKLSATLKTGEYSVKYDHSSLGEDVYYLPDTVKVTITDTTTALDLYLKNTTPNGTEGRPYTLNFGDNEITIPANTSYYYAIYRSVNYYVVVNSENVKVTYKTTEYTPDAQGLIAIQLLGASTNSVDMLKFTNPTDSEQTYSLNISSAAGSQSNPYQLTLDQDITTKAIEANTSLYYTFTATQSGKLTITLKSEDSYISATNRGSNVSVNTSESNVIELDVTAGQTVSLDCSVTITSGATASVTFSATFTANE